MQSSLYHKSFCHLQMLDLWCWSSYASSWTLYDSKLHRWHSVESAIEKTKKAENYERLAPFTKERLGKAKVIGWWGWSGTAAAVAISIILDHIYAVCANYWWQPFPALFATITYYMARSWKWSGQNRTNWTACYGLVVLQFHPTNPQIHFLNLLSQ